MMSRAGAACGGVGGVVPRACVGQLLTLGGAVFRLTGILEPTGVALEMLPEQRALFILHSADYLEAGDEEARGRVDAVLLRGRGGEAPGRLQRRAEALMAQPGGGGGEGEWISAASRVRGIRHGSGDCLTADGGLSVCCWGRRCWRDAVERGRACAGNRAAPGAGGASPGYCRFVCGGGAGFDGCGGVVRDGAGGRDVARGWGVFSAAVLFRGVRAAASACLGRGFGAILFDRPGWHCGAHAAGGGIAE